jgi:hypothetical protein
MALKPCPECKNEVSDKAPTCPHCGYPLIASPSGSSAPSSALTRITGGVLLAAVVAGGFVLALRRPDYSLVEQLREDQDEEGTHDEHTRQRFFRSYKTHPGNAMYAYLWARCVDDAAKQLELAQEGIRDDASFAWNYNMASRALARLNRVPEAYDMAVKGLALDPANLELANKQKSLKVMIDHKLAQESAPKPTEYVRYDNEENFKKGAVKYEGLFRSAIRRPDASDVRAMDTGRLFDTSADTAEGVHGFVLCANPYADMCMRVFVTKDGRFKSAWPPSAIDVGALHEQQLVAVAGAVATTVEGVDILLADSVAVETP